VTTVTNFPRGYRVTFCCVARNAPCNLHKLINTTSNIHCNIITLVVMYIFFSFGAMFCISSRQVAIKVIAIFSSRQSKHLYSSFEHVNSALTRSALPLKSSLSYENTILDYKETIQKKCFCFAQFSFYICRNKQLKLISPITFENES
jgi:hypothetical protein